MKKGFTLIELLAVIVILSIIAVIAVPIVIDIIEDTKIQSDKRSIEMYVKAVENSILTNQMNEDVVGFIGTYKPEKTTFGGTPNTKLINTADNNITIDVEYDGAEIICEGVTIYSDGKIYMEGCKVNGNGNYTYGTEQESASSEEKVCTIVKQNASKYSIGDVVTCNIGDEPDKFYVIEEADLATSSTIQVLTEFNINTTEPYRQSSSAGLVSFSTTNYWSSEATYPAYVYGDYQQNLVYPIVNEYISYLNSRLTGATGSLLTHSQAENLGCIGDNAACAPGVNGGGNAPVWVYSISYWTGSADDADSMWCVNSHGEFARTSFNIETGGVYGVRPVITIQVSDINIE